MTTTAARGTPAHRAPRAARLLVVALLAVTSLAGFAQAAGPPQPPPPPVPFADLLSGLGAGGVPGPFGSPTGTGDGTVAAYPTSAAPAPSPAVAAARAPGTLTTVAGGHCDGLPALEATIDPGRVAVDKAGRLFWVDQFWGQRHKTSVVLRTLAGGRVRTLGALFDRPSGPYWRGIPGGNDYYSDLVPDDRGGVYYTFGYGGDVAARRYGSYPLFGFVGHMDAAGHRTVVVGAPPGAPLLGLPPEQAGDGGLPHQTHYDAVTSVALDRDGNLFFLADNRVWVYNRGHAPLVFYPGTQDERRIAPGRVGLVTGWRASEPTDLAGKRAATYTGLVFWGRDLAVDADRNVYVLAGNTGLTTVLSGGHVDAVNTTGKARTMLGVLVDAAQYATVAGDDNVPAGYTPDGAPAVGAAFGLQDFPWEYGTIALDGHSNLLLADTENNAVRGIDATTGLLGTVAGVPSPGGLPGPYTGNRIPGTGGYNGDGHPARETLLNRPMGLAFDPAGRLVFADWDNQRIRRVEAAGTVRTIAGRGFESPCGDGHPATSPLPYGGPFLGLPIDVAVDSAGNRYVSDGMWRVIRKIDARGMVSTAAGVPSPCAARSNITQGTVPLAYSEPQCPLGTFGGEGGPPERAGFVAPTWIQVDEYDNLFVVDVDRLRYVNFSDRKVSVVGHDVAAHSVVTLYQSAAQTFTVPIAPDVPDGAPVYQLLLHVAIGLGDVELDGKGNVFLADTLHRQVLELGRCGGVARIVGSGKARASDNGDGGIATEAAITPMSLTYDKRDRVLYLVSTGEAKGANGYLVRAANLSNRRVVALGQAIGAHRIATVAGRGNAVRPGGDWGDGGHAVDAVMYYPWGLAFSEGRLFVSDWIYRVRAIEADGTIGTVLGRPYFSRREGFTPDNAYRIVGSWGDGGPATDGGVDVPGGVTLAPDGSLLVTSAADGRIRSIADARAMVPRHFPDKLLHGLDGAARLFDAVDRPPATERMWFGVPDTVSAAGEPVTDPAFVAAPDGAWYLVARNGLGARGCRLWHVVTAPGRRATVTRLGIRSANGLDGVSCSVAAGPGGPAVAESVVEPEAPGVTDDSPLALAVGSRDATDPGTVDLLPGLPTAGAPVGAEQAWLTTVPDGYLLAYHDALGIEVAHSANGVAYLPRGSIAAHPARLGRIVAAHGTAYLPYVVDRLDGPEVWVARSTDGGATWTPARVARLDVDVESTPSVAVDRAGGAYAVWAAAGHVWLASSRDGAAWRAPVRVDQGFRQAALPSVVAGDAGRVDVVWYGTTADDLDAIGSPQWRVYLAQTFAAQAARPAFARHLAVATVVHHGSVCTMTSIACRHIGDMTANLGSALAVSLDADGGALVAFTEGPERFGSIDGGSGRLEVVSVVRQCHGSGLVRGRTPGGCPPPDRAAQADVPPGDHTGYVPDIPPLPVVDLPGLLPCSPLPPDGRPQAPDVADRPEQAKPRLPTLIGAAPFLAPPIEVPADAPAPGNAPANAQAQQLNQQPNTQSEPMPNFGFGAEQDEQRQENVAYAMSALAGAAALTAAAAWALEKQRRAALSVVRSGGPR